MSVVLFYKCKKAGEYRQPSLYYNFGGTIADNHFILSHHYLLIQKENSTFVASYCNYILIK